MSTSAEITRSSHHAATAQDLLQRFTAVRMLTQRICEPLSVEDCMVQSMPDVSPTRWHLAHTTWFFEQFVLLQQSGYQPFDKRFNYLFNSYYNTVGDQFPRHQRGLISRPGLAEVQEYRKHIDEHMSDFLSGERIEPELLEIIEIGLNHEQQHQELMLTDIKHVLSCNPLSPVYDTKRIEISDNSQRDWIAFDNGNYEIGHASDAFAYDNESPRHKVYCQSFSLSSRPATCGEFLDFIEDGGYQRPDHWLSMGWATVQQNGWTAPMYWSKCDGQWRQFTLCGVVDIEPHQPVCHVSYFEADAFARWSQARLPTEAEWEVAAATQPVDGNFANRLLDSNLAIHPSSATQSKPFSKIYGDVWEWTASQYVAYPGYEAPAGAIGEYNGKFMCNQFVLRGGSCASSSDHLRPTYRNFFPPDARWQFSGIRLAK